MSTSDKGHLTTSTVRQQARVSWYRPKLYLMQFISGDYAHSRPHSQPRHLIIVYSKVGGIFPTSERMRSESVSQCAHERYPTVAGNTCMCTGSKREAAQRSPG